jgi:hypothetical protein
MRPQADLTVVSEQEGKMDNELKQCLDEMAGDIMRAIAEMENRIMSELRTPAARLDAVARNLEGDEEVIPDSDATRIEAGH